MIEAEAILRVEIMVIEIDILGMIEIEGEKQRSTGRESENERFERRVADGVKKALVEKKGK